MGGVWAAIWLIVAVSGGVAAGGSVLYLLALLCAALVGVRRETANAANAKNAVPLRFAIVVPAHNEELVLDATLTSLLHLDYPADLMEIVVIADNCIDNTARIAEERGATVWERENLSERGKGYALQWAFAKLLTRATPPDAFVVVDADTFVNADFLTVMAAALAARSTNGLCALQGRYGVLNASENWRTALMAGAFDLFNHVKPLGRDRLNLSVGLKGNGMAFTRPVMETIPWQGTSITEDIDYGLDLLDKGVRVGYVPRAKVAAQMPTTARAAASQRQRWEGGRANLLKTRALFLFAKAVRTRNAAYADAAIDLLIPPLAELAALLLVWGIWIVAGVFWDKTAQPVLWLVLWINAALGFVAYIFVGFWVSGAPRQAYLSLLFAPGYAVWKIALMAARPFRRKAKPSGTTEKWVRTERAPMPSSAPGTVSGAVSGKETAP